MTEKRITLILEGFPTTICHYQIRNQRVPTMDPLKSLVRGLKVHLDNYIMI